MSLKSLIKQRIAKGFYFRITIPWPTGPLRDIKKEETMGLWTEIKERFAWKRLLPFLKLIFKGLPLLLIDGLKDLAIETAKEVAAKGLPNDEAKRKEFEKIMRQKAKEEGLELKDSALNLLRELAIQFIKNINL